ncbi:MAG TPA: CSLREA domain-containing protein, partial [Anaerolineaceae bacterium]
MKTQTLRFLLPIALAFSLLAPSTIAHAAGFVVTKTADTADGTCDADCSLREAIIAANAAAGDDIITVPAGTYTLTIPGTGENAAATGDLDIKSNITINGAGAGTTIIDGGALDRVFEVFRAFTVNISGVTVRNGNLTGDDGGGIFNNAGTLTITNSTFSGNSTIYEGGGFGGAGGGVYTYGGPVTITNSTFSGNSASSQGGGIYIEAGTLTVTQSTFTQNNAGDSGGGILNQNGTASITNSTFSGNSAVVTGGGILGNGASTLTITNSTFSGNSAADGYGGGLRISGGTA